MGLLALAVPVAAGVVAGRLLVRRGSAAPARDAVLTGLSTGAVLALLGWLSGGPAGGSRLAETGPSPLRFGFAVAAEIAVGALAAVWLSALSDARAHARDEDDLEDEPAEDAPAEA